MPTGSRAAPRTRYGDVPRCLRRAIQIRKQLATTEGVAGYSLDARLPDSPAPPAYHQLDISKPAPALAACNGF